MFLIEKFLHFRGLHNTNWDKKLYLYLNVSNGVESTANYFICVFYVYIGSGYEDILLLESTISILSGETRVPVLLEIIDDVIVERLYEDIRINIAPSSGQQSLFKTGQIAEVTIRIRDNDSKLTIILR